MDPNIGIARSGDEHDEGFSLIEQVIAMTVLFTVLLGLLVALGAGARGIANGRQRTIATSLAKQTIEQLQGSSYSAVAMNLSSPNLATDSRVTGIAPNRKFESEPLVGGATAPYTIVTSEGGATFVVTTFVTAVTPATGSPHRRITVLVEWNPSTSGNVHSMRFSSLVYPLDYTSYPASSGTGESIGAAARVTGYLGVDTFDDVYLALPSARSATTSSTLRAAQGSASSSTGAVNVAAGPVSSSSSSCTVSGVSNDIAECVLSTTDSTADNDAGSTAGDVSQTVNAAFSAASVSTPGGMQVTTPAGTSTTRVSTDSCNLCVFGDGDGAPWAEGESSTTTGSSGTFSAFNTTLTGSLWNLAPGWTPSAVSDHDPASGGVVVSAAKIHAPPVDVLRLDGVAGYTAAVKIGAFDAAVSATAGNAAAAPSATLTMPTVDIWNGTAYQTVSVTPGTPVEVVATPFVIGDHQVQLTSRVQAQPSSVTSAGSTLKTDSVAQFPSLMVVTVDTVVTSVTSGLRTAAFVVTFDFGRISAHSTWVQQ